MKSNNCNIIEDLTDPISSTSSCDCSTFFSHAKEFIVKGLREDEF